MENKPKYSNNEIYQMVKSLCEKVDDGFSGVHKRQDKTNGKVVENTEFRLKSTGAIKVIQWLVSIFGGLTIVNVLVTIFEKINN